MDHQYDILKTEFLLCQQQMDKYDQLSQTIRTWSVTLWAASLGWFFQTRVHGVLILSITVVLIFWMLDAMLKNFRESYKDRRNEVAALLEEFFKTGKLPENASAPQLPGHERTRFVSRLFRPHIFPLYLTLTMIAAVLLYFA